jgi:hypothetical protein
MGAPAFIPIHLHCLPLFINCKINCLDVHFNSSEALIKILGGMRDGTSSSIPAYSIEVLSHQIVPNHDFSSCAETATGSNRQVSVPNDSAFLGQNLVRTWFLPHKTCLITFLSSTPSIVKSKLKSLSAIIFVYERRFDHFCSRQLPHFLSVATHEPSLHL